MIIYLATLLITLILVYASTKVENKKIGILLKVLAILPFIIISGIRYNVGTDYLYRYVPNYNTFASGGTVNSLEPMFKVLIYFCLIFTKDSAMLFIVTSIIIITLVMLNIFKNSKNMILSILIFFCGSFFFESLNLVRQFISMAIIFVSYKLLINNKNKAWWIISILIATLFHSMSIVFLIAIFLDKEIINTKFLIIAIICIIFLGCFIPNIIDTVIGNTFLKNIDNINKYVKYFKTGGDLPLSNIIVELGIYIYINLMYRNAKHEKKEITKETIFFVNMQTMALLCTVMNIHYKLFFRITLLFSFFQILSIPYFYEINKKEEFKINNKQIKNGCIILTILVISLMSSRMIFSNVIKGADEVLPYKTILSRD